MIETRFQLGTGIRFYLKRDDYHKAVLHCVNLLESQLQNWKDYTSCSCRKFKPAFLANDEVFTTNWTQRK
jgi:hypothetical protein